MRKILCFLQFLVLFLYLGTAHAQVKISQLPLKAASTVGTNDSFPYVNVSLGETDRIRLQDLLNLTSFQTQFLSMIPDQTSQSGKCLGTNGSATSWVACGGGGSSFYQTVQSDGTPETQRANLNFSTDFSLTDSSGSDRTTVACQVASASQQGCLDTTDWSTFNSKVSTARTIATTAPLVGGGDLSADRTLACNVASSSQPGCLSSTDWSTFNGKQASLTIGNLTDAGTDGITVGSGSGAVIGSGTTLSQHVADATHNGYLSSTDWNSFNTAAGGGVTSISVASTNGFAGSSSGGTTPILTISTTITGLIKGNGTAISAASAGTDYVIPAGNVATATALAANPTDCGSNVYATSIDAQGNLTCASITNASTTASSSAGNSTIVLRDGSGNFAAGTITASLTGGASLDLPLAGGALTGEVTQTETRTTTSSSTDSEFSISQTANPAGNSSTNFRGQSILTQTTTGNTHTFASLGGLNVDTEHDATSALTTGTGIYSLMRAGSSGNASNLTTASSGFFETYNDGTGTIGTAYGLLTSVQNRAAGAITTAYGLYINTVQGTTKYGLFENSGGINKFAGNVGIGVSPSDALDVKGTFDLEGATSGAFKQQAAGTTASYTVIWPSGQSSGSKCLVNDGSGNLSWSSCGGSGFVAQTSSTGAAEMPSGTTGQRDGSPANGYIRYNSSIGSMEFFTGSQWFPLDIQATPTNTQTETAAGAFSWTVPTGVTKVAVVVVGGGGGGGGPETNTIDCGAGGGGAIPVYNNHYNVIPGTVINGFVGAGGAGGTQGSSTGGAGAVGQDSYFGDLVALGGTGGAGTATTATARGNGGGAASGAAATTYTYGTSALFPGSSFGFFSGGTFTGSSGSTAACGGGAGGANGSNAAASVGGNGAAGVTILGTTYGGGGGGGTANSGGTAGTGGSGGGGNGSKRNAAQTAGTVNTGGGGGGGAGADNGAAGGRGVVNIYWDI